MLTDYIPEYIGGDRSPRAARYVLQGLLNDSDAETHQLSHNDLTTYTTDSKELAISAPSIIDTIDWHSLPEEHPLTPERDGAGWTPDEWSLISKYARIRGIAAHSLQTTPTAERASHEIHDDINQIKRVEQPDQMYSTVYEWTGSRDRMMPPDTVRDLDTSTSEQLYESCKEGARYIADNWHLAAQHHSLSILLNEATIIVEIDGVLFCARPDQIAYTDDSPTLPAGLYTVDAKSTARIQPEHVLQAEAQRRAVASRLADDKDVHAIILRLGVEKGDWDIHSSLNDDWNGEKAWDMFCRKAETLYSDGLVQAELSKVSR